MTESAQIMREAVKVFRLVEERNAVSFELIDAEFGASAYFKCGHPFPEETKAICDQADAIIKGPLGLGHEESKKIPIELLPERGAKAISNSKIKPLPSSEFMMIPDFSYLMKQDRAHSLV